MPETLVNDSVCTLSAQLLSSTGGGGTISVASPGAPTGAVGQNARVRIGTEILLVTITSATSWTIVSREAEDSDRYPKATWPAGTGADFVLTAAGFFAVVPNGVYSQIATAKVTTATSELLLEETGDSNGTIRVRLQNRTGANGVMVENVSQDLSEFLLKTSGAATRNVRLENRAFVVIAAPELQLGAAGAPTLAVADTGRVAVADTNTANSQELRFYNFSSTGVYRLVGGVLVKWIVSTDASRTGRVTIYAQDFNGLREGFRVDSDGTQALVSWFGAAAVAKQASGANLTNNVTAGGTNDTIANYTDLATYANDAAAIRNNLYQLARKLKQVNDALRAYGLLT